MRLFVASPVCIDCYDSIRHDFEGVVEGTWVAEENLHMTWIFLGQQDESESWKRRLAKIPVPHRSAPLDSLGFFGRPPHILYAGSSDPDLYETARSMKRTGLNVTRFRPHVTLCRIKRIRNYRRLRQLRREYRDRILGEILPQIQLCSSRLEQEGPHYRVLAAFSRSDRK